MPLGLCPNAVDGLSANRYGPAQMYGFRSALRNPWWIPPFLGGVPAIEPRLISMLGLVSLALFFEQYDNSMLTAALKFIARDLDMAERDLGGFLAAIRLGAVPAFLLVPFADGIGRRRVFLASVVGFSVGTCLTGFSRTPGAFVAMQTLTRTFMMTGSAVAVVIVTEEFPAAHRGWAIGMLGALSACGHGLGAGLFAAIDVLPCGWRSLYAVGLVPLFVLPWFRRHIVETGRFNRHRAGGAARERPSRLADWYRPLASLARTHPLRAAALAVAGGLFAIGEASVFQFTGYFTQTVHGWSPGQFSLMVIIGGAIGIIGNVVAGRLGDAVGRRAVGVAFFVFFPLFAWIFYHGPGWTLPAAWVGFVFCSSAAGMIIRAFSAELFPTSHRGTSAACLSLVQTLGWAMGLALVGLGTREPGDIARMSSLISLAALAGGFALLFLPETARQELEVLSDETCPLPDEAGDCLQNRAATGSARAVGGSSSTDD